MRKDATQTKDEDRHANIDNINAVVLFKVEEFLVNTTTKFFTRETKVKNAAMGATIKPCDSLFIASEDKTLEDNVSPKLGVNVSFVQRVPSQEPKIP